MDQALHQVPGGGGSPRIRVRNWRQPGTAGERGLNAIQGDRHGRGSKSCARGVFAGGGRTAAWRGCVESAPNSASGSPRVRVDNGAFDAAGRWLTRAAPLVLLW